jgi:hypothetical protein
MAPLHFETQILTNVDDGAESFICVRHFSELIGIEPEGKNIAILEREPLLKIQNYLESLELRQSLSFKSHIDFSRTNILSEELSHLPRDSDSNRSGHLALAQDVFGIVTAAMGLLKTAQATVHFEVVTHDNCRLFHTDRPRLRLLCTYFGPGTLWVPNHYVSRSEFGKGQNQRIVPDATKVRQVKPYWIALLKGEDYPGNEMGGVVHRSPPIEESGQRRVLLRIDFGSECYC